MTHSLWSKRTFLWAIPLMAVLLQGCQGYRESGVWSGTAIQARSPWGETEACSMKVDLHRDSNSLQFHSVSWNCSREARAWSSSSFEIFGSSLYVEDQYWGRADSDGSGSLILSENSRILQPSSDVLEVSWYREGDDLVFTETSGRGSGRRTISGRLTRVGWN